MIKSIDEKKGPIEIDLTGPDGNVFALMAHAKQLVRLLNERRGADYLDFKAIQADMTSDDYEHAIQVFEKHFGDIVILYR